MGNMVIFLKWKKDNYENTLFRSYCTSLSILVCFGCKTKEEAKPITWPTTKLNLDTLWRFPNEYSIAPTLNSNKDLLISEMFQMEGDVFKLIDGSTGKLKWKWFDYFQKEEGFIFNTHASLKMISWY
jgi:hypothetical protein